ncbi:MAG: hypothetical protein HRT61_01375 [Ekhidna sp.]|nr:hypothetical protein [Ekhidna sp.]
MVNRTSLPVPPKDLDDTLRKYLEVAFQNVEKLFRDRVTITKEINRISTANGELVTQTDAIAARLNDANGTGSTFEAFVGTTNTVIANLDTNYASASQVTSIQSTIDDVVGDGISLVSFVTQTNQTLSTLGAGGTTTSAQIEQLRSRLDNVDSAVPNTTIEAFVTSAKSTLASLATDKAEVSVVNQLGTDVQTAQTTADGAVTGISTITDRIDNINSSGTTIETFFDDTTTAISSLDGTYAQLTNFNTLSTTVGDNTTAIGTLTGTLQTNTDNVSTLTGRVNNINSSGINLETFLTNYNTLESSLPGTYATITVTDDLRTDVNQATTDIGELDGELVIERGRIDTINGTINNLTTENIDLATFANNTVTGISNLETGKADLSVVNTIGTQAETNRLAIISDGINIQGNTDAIATERGRLDSVNASGTNIEAFFTQTQNFISNLNGNVATTTVITNLTNRVGTAETDIIGIDGRLITTEGDVVTIEGRLDTVSQSSKTLETFYDETIEAVADLETGKASVEVVNGISSVANQARDDIVGLNGRVTITEDDITDIEGRFDNFRFQGQTIEAAINSIDATLVDIPNTYAEATRVDELEVNLTEIQQQGLGFFQQYDELSDVNVGSSVTVTQTSENYFGSNVLEIRQSGDVSSVDTTGNTSGAWLNVPQDIAINFADRKIRMAVLARAAPTNPASSFAVVYSTADAGNSGLLSTSSGTIPVDSTWRWYTFYYDVAPNSVGVFNGDFFGIFVDSGDTTGILVARATIELSANAEDIPSIAQVEGRVETVETATGNLQTGKADASRVDTIETRANRNYSSNLPYRASLLDEFVNTVAAGGPDSTLSANGTVQIDSNLGETVLYNWSNIGDKHYTRGTANIRGGQTYRCYALFRVTNLPADGTVVLAFTASILDQNGNHLEEIDIAASSFTTTGVKTLAGTFGPSGNVDFPASGVQFRGGLRLISSEPAGFDIEIAEIRIENQSIAIAANSQVQTFAGAISDLENEKAEASLVTSIQAGLTESTSYIFPSRASVLSQFSNSRFGNPSSLSDVTATVVTDNELGACAELNWTTVGTNIMTKGVIPTFPTTRKYRLRCTFRIVSMPSDANVRFGFVAAGMEGDYTEKTNSTRFFPSTEYTSTGVYTLESTIGPSGSTGLTTTFPSANLADIYRFGFRLDTSESSTGGVIVRVASFEIDDITDINAIQTDVTSINDTLNPLVNTTVVDLRSDVDDALAATVSLENDKAEASRVDSLESIAIGTSTTLVPSTLNNLEQFTPERYGLPENVPAASGPIINDPDIGTSIEQTWTASGTRLLHRPLIPVTETPTFKVRVIFKIVSLPTDGVADISLGGWVLDGTGTGLTGSTFGTSTDYTTTGVKVLEGTYGPLGTADYSSFTDAVYARFGLRMSSADPSPGVTIRVASIEVTDITDITNTNNLLTTTVGNLDTLTQEVTSVRGIAETNESTIADLPNQYAASTRVDTLEADVTTLQETGSQFTVVYDALDVGTTGSAATSEFRANVFGQAGVVTVRNVSSVTPDTTGNTNGYYVGIPRDTALNFMGKRIRIDVLAKQPSLDPSTTFAVVYSTADNGNSGLLAGSSNLTGSWQFYTFYYDVPIAISGGGDVLGIFSTGTNGQGVEIARATIQYALDSEDPTFSNLNSTVENVQTTVSTIEGDYTTASDLTSLSSTLTGQISQAETDAINTAGTNATNYTNTREGAIRSDLGADINQAEADAITAAANLDQTLETRVEGALGGTLEALSAAGQTLTSQIGDVNASVTTLANTRVTQVENDLGSLETNLSASYTIQIDGNGRLSSIRLVDDGSTSAIELNADIITAGTLDVDTLIATEAIIGNKIQRGAITESYVDELGTDSFSGTTYRNNKVEVQIPSLNINDFVEVNTYIRYADTQHDIEWKAGDFTQGLNIPTVNFDKINYSSVPSNKRFYRNYFLLEGQNGNTRITLRPSAEGSGDQWYYARLEVIVTKK